MLVATWPPARDIPAQDITIVRPHPVLITPGTATTATITPPIIIPDQPHGLRA